MTNRCEGRYPVSSQRSEPFEVTYRCGLHQGHQGPCAAARCGHRSGHLVCDREANHEGNHRGYNEQIDEPMFWPPISAAPCAPWTVVMDFPTAWAFIREQHPDPSEHDPRCSWVQAKGGILCDCHVLNDEYERRKNGNSAGAVSSGEPESGNSVPGVPAEPDDPIRVALEDLNLHCTDHAPDPDCEGCRTQLAGFRFDLDGPAGGARAYNRADQGTAQSTGTLSTRLADCVAVLTSIEPPIDHPSVLLSRYRYQQCLDLLREAAFATGSMVALGQRQRTVRETIASLAKSGWLTEDEAAGIFATLPEPRESCI